MSMSLSGMTRTLAVSHATWGDLLSLAKRNGWIPAGTEEPIQLTEDQKWSGGYWSNDGQLVTEEDAASLADALDRAVGDVSGCDLPAYEPGTVGDFIHFCREGGFRIY